jgi:hypothetical protein
LDFINKLNPVNYVFKNDINEKIRHGFIAQEVESLGEFNEISLTNENIYGLNYNGFIAPLVKAVQELTSENKILKSQIENMNEQFILINNQLKELRELIGINNGL